MRLEVCRKVELHLIDFILYHQLRFALLREAGVALVDDAEHGALRPFLIALGYLLEVRNVEPALVFRVELEHLLAGPLGEDCITSSLQLLGSVS